MAYWIDPTDHDQNGGTRSFLADAETDIALLPTSVAVGTGGINDTDNEKVAIGSSCLCIGNAGFYMLNSSNIWTKM